MAKLVVLSAGLAGTSYELKVERTTIGRVEDNAFQIAEQSISSHHCEILLKGADVVVRDLNSTNGTYINGQAIKESVLKPGQALRLGSVELKLDDGSAPAAPPAKKQQTLDHTIAMSGVKLNELESTTRVVGSPFAKKSNKLNKIFFIVGAIIGLLIIATIVYAIFQADAIKQP